MRIGGHTREACVDACLAGGIKMKKKAGGLAIGLIAPVVRSLKARFAGDQGLGTRAVLRLDRQRLLVVGR